MTIDLIGGWLHFLGAFALAGALFAQMAMLGAGLTGPAMGRVARFDAIYGASAALVLAGGLIRVFWGARGAAFYLENPWFHLKLTLFVLAAILSILPTIRFRKWAKAAKADPAWAPPADQARRIKMFVHIQLLLVVLIILAAGLMARFYAL